MTLLVSSWLAMAGLNDKSGLQHKHLISHCLVDPSQLGNQPIPDQLPVPAL